MKEFAFSSSAWPQICQRVLLTVQSDSEPAGGVGQARTFFTMVQDITPDAVAVGLPMSGTNYIPMGEGQRVALSYVDNRAAYRLEGPVIKMDLQHGPALLWIGLEQPPRRIQRRRFVRIDVALPVRARNAVMAAPSGTGADGDDDSAWHRGRTVNLSGGGMGLLTAAPLPRRGLVDLQVEVDGRWVAIRGRVVRQGETNDQVDPPVTKYAVGFTDIGAQDQDHIIRFVFAEQRRRRQVERGWGR